MKTLKLLGAALAAVTMTFTAQAEKTPKVLVKDDAKTLRFVYDDEDHGIEGTYWFALDAKAPTGAPLWNYNNSSTVTAVIFDPSFKDFKPTDCDSWFFGLQKLTSITGIENLDTSEATSLYCMFQACVALTTLDVSGFDTSNVTDMSSMFSGCKALTSLDVSGFDTSNVTDMSSMFSGCKALTSLDVSGFDTAKVTGMNNIFYGCQELTELDVSSFDTSKVTDMRLMFSGCKKLKAIYASDTFVTKSVENGKTENMFLNCSALPGSDDNGVLQRFSPLPKVVVEDDGATLRFVRDKSSQHGVRGKDWYSVVAAGELAPSANPPWSAHCGTVTKVVVDPAFGGCQPKHFGSWFYSFTKLSSIEGLAYLDTSAATSMAWMFGYCSTLTTLDLSGFRTKTVTDMNHLFYGCSGIARLDLSGFDTANVANMMQMFANCSSLKSINASSRFLTDAATMSYEMFAGCSAQLKGGAGTTWDNANPKDRTYARVDDPANGKPGYFTETTPKAVVSGSTLKFVFDSINYGAKGSGWFSVAEAEAIDPALENEPWFAVRDTITKVVFDASFAKYRPQSCANWFYCLDKVTEIEGLWNLDTSEVTSMRGMFQNCGVTRLDLSCFNTAEVTDMSVMFSGAANLKTIHVAADFVPECLAESGNMFLGCTSLWGGKGTQYSPSHVDFEYARYDKGPDSYNPGYFSYVPCVCVEGDGTLLAFRISGEVKASRNRGVDWYPVAQGETASPPWNKNRGIKRVDFEKFFADYRPKSCAQWFANLNELSLITGIGYLDTSEVTSMRGMFSQCRSLKALDLFRWDTAKVTDTSYMFDGCSQLGSIYASDAFKTDLVTDSTAMFRDCTALTGGKGTTYSEANPKDAAYARFDGGEAQPGYFTMVPKVVVEDGGKTLRFVCDGRSDYETAFSVIDEEQRGELPEWNQYRLVATKIIIDPSFTGYRPRTCYGWFFRFNNVTEIEGLEYLDTSEVTDMEGMFSGIGVESLDLSSFNTANVTDMSDMFSECVNLAALDLSSFNTANVTNMYQMFRQCVNLAAINLSSFNTAKVTDMHNMFQFCGMNTRIELLDLSSFDTTSLLGSFLHQEGVAGMFSNCGAVTLDLSGFDTTKLKNAPAYMFEQCVNLTTIYATEKLTFPSLDTNARVNMAECGGLFQGCINLVGGMGTKWKEGCIGLDFAHVDGLYGPGYYTYKAPAVAVGYAAWAAEQGLAGDDAAWDAKPSKWGGEWANAFIYTYGEGLAGGTLAIMNISFDVNGKPVITTTPVVEGHTDFTPAVIGTPNLQNWTSPVVLENMSGDDWTLPVGAAANFFRVRLSE